MSRGRQLARWLGWAGAVSVASTVACRRGDDGATGGAGARAARVSPKNLGEAQVLARAGRWTVSRGDVAALVPGGLGQGDARLWAAAVELAVDASLVWNPLPLADRARISGQVEAQAVAPAAAAGGVQAWQSALALRWQTPQAWQLHRRTQLAVDVLLGAVLQAPIQAEEVAKYYAKHQTLYARAEQLRFAELAVHAETEAELAAARRALLNAREQLEQGREFAEVSQLLTNGIAAARGHQRGWTSPSELDPRLAKALLGVQVGQTTAIVQTEFGLHLARLLERIPGHPLPLAQAEPLVIQHLLAERAVTLRLTKLQELRAAAPLEWSGASGVGSPFLAAPQTQTQLRTRMPASLAVAASQLSPWARAGQLLAAVALLVSACQSPGVASLPTQSRQGGSGPSPFLDSAGFIDADAGAQGSAGLAEELGDGIGSPADLGTAATEGAGNTAGDKGDTADPGKADIAVDAPAETLTDPAGADSTLRQGDATAEDAVDATKDTAADVIKDAGADATKDIAADVTKDAGADVIKDAGADATKDIAADVTKDIAVDVTKDIAVDVTKDIAVDVTKDIAADVTKDIAADVTKDAGADATKDTAADVTKDAGADVIKDTAADSGQDAAVKDVPKDAADIADSADAAANDAAEVLDGPAQVDAAADVDAGPLPVWASDPKKAVANLHQTWQHDPASTLTLSWTTEWADPKTYVPRALFAKVADAGPDGAQLLQTGQVATGTFDTYTAVLAAGGKQKAAWHVELVGLQPDTEYVVRVGTWTSIGPSATALVGAELGLPASFRTTPPKGSTAAMTMVFAGDSRSGLPQIQANMAYYEKIQALAWFFNGDMSPVGTQDEWNAWFTTLQPVLRRRPLMPVQGNHETLADHYYAQFALPVAPGLPINLQEHAWSLDIGNVHVIGLDANSEAMVAGQAPWLAADLQAAQSDPAIEWIVATMHQSPYSACPVHGSTAYVQKHWVPLFEKYGVDLVFSGHDHNYERSHPIAANKVAGANQGVTYVVAGAFFAPPYANGKNWWTAVSHPGNGGNLAILTVQGKALQVKVWSGDGKTALDSFGLAH